MPTYPVLFTLFTCTVTAVIWGTTYITCVHCIVVLQKGVTAVKFGELHIYIYTNVHCIVVLQKGVTAVKFGELHIYIYTNVHRIVVLQQGVTAVKFGELHIYIPMCTALLCYRRG